LIDWINNAFIHAEMESYCFIFIAYGQVINFIYLIKIAKMYNKKLAEKTWNQKLKI